MQRETESEDGCCTAAFGGGGQGHVPPVRMEAKASSYTVQEAREAAKGKETGSPIEPPERACI